MESADQIMVSEMFFESIAFIGGGQMAEALIKGILSRGIVSAENISCSEPNRNRREYIAREYGITVYAENVKAVSGAEAIVLAVKPQVISSVLQEIANTVDDTQLVISIAAGISTEFIEAGIGREKRVIRVMPNTPALVQQGATALCRGSSATVEDLARARSLFEAVGVAVEVQESLMDAVTGLSGSGPAWCFTFMDALIQAGVKEGLSRDVASTLAVQTVIGAAEICKQTGKEPAQLTAMVTSPGGTTIHGMYRLHEKGFTAAVMDAVSAATARSRELGGNK